MQKVILKTNGGDRYECDVAMDSLKVAASLFDRARVKGKASALGGGVTMTAKKLEG